MFLTNEAFADVVNKHPIDLMEVDPPLRKIVNRLNHYPFVHTTFSCAGHGGEELLTRDKDHIPRISNGYVCFVVKEDDQAQDFINHLAYAIKRFCSFHYLTNRHLFNNAPQLGITTSWFYDNITLNKHVLPNAYTTWKIELVGHASDEWWVKQLELLWAHLEDTIPLHWSEVVENETYHVLLGSDSEYEATLGDLVDDLRSYTDEFTLDRILMDGDSLTGDSRVLETLVHVIQSQHAEIKEKETGKRLGWRIGYKLRDGTILTYYAYRNRVYNQPLVLKENDFE